MAEPGFSASMGNFKGVMLCNRPAQVSGSMQSSKPPHGGGSDTGQSGGVGGGKGAVPHSHASEMNTKPHMRDPTGNDRPAFVGAVAPTVPVGLRPMRKKFPKSANAKSIQDNVTYRHKQWLTHFTEQRNDAMRRLHADLFAEQAKRSRIADKAAAQRAAVRSVSNSTVGTPLNAAMENERRRLQDAMAMARAPAAADSSSTVNVMTVHAPAPAAAVAAAVPLPAPPKAAQSSAPPASAGGGGVSPRKAKAKAAAAAGAADAKPVWARTAKENDDLEEAELDGLVNFASGLSFDTYMKDMEVREAVRAMQNRVAQIETEQAAATAREQADQARAAHAEQQQRLRELNMKLGGPSAADNDDDEWEEYEEDEVIPLDATAAAAAALTATGAAAAAAAQPATRKVIRRRRKAKRPATGAAGGSTWSADAPHYTDAALTSARTAGGPAPKELADRVLHSSHAMRGIHSSQSMRAMIDKASAKLAATAAANGAGGAAGATTRLPTLYDHQPLPASTLPPLPSSPTNINPTTMSAAQLAAAHPANPQQPLPSLAIAPPLVTVNRQPSLVRPENGLNPSLLPFLRRHPVV